MNAAFRRRLSLLLVIIVLAPPAVALQAPDWGDYPVHPEAAIKLLPEMAYGWLYPLPPEPSGSNLLDLDWYVELFPPDTDIVSTAIWTITPTDDLQDELLLEMGEELAISGVYYNGEPADYSRDGWYLHIELEPALSYGETAEVRIDYSGYFDIIEEQDSYYEIDFDHQEWAQTTHQYLPCYDYPSDKFTVTQRLNVPEGWTMLANGILEEIIDEGDGRETHIWRMNHDCAMYLIWFGGRPEDELAYIEFVTEPFPIGYYCHPSEVDGYTDLNSYLPDLITCYEEHYGPYGFDALYHQTINWGMEWQAMSDMPVVHEDAHMWFGDLLSPASWDHSWLNEGFATWSEAFWAEQPEADDDPQQKRERWSDEYFYQYDDYAWQKVPIVYKRIYAQLIYYKGAFVVEMLRREMGYEAFFDGLRAYTATHRYGNVLTSDLQAAMEDYYVSDEHDDLSWFFNQWVFSPGHPQYHWRYEFDEVDGEPVINIDLNQVQSSLYGSPYAFDTLVDVYIYYNDVTTQLITLHNNQRRQSFTVPLEQAPENIHHMGFNDEFTTLCTAEIVESTLEITAVINGEGIDINGELYYGVFDEIKLYRVKRISDYLLDEPVPYDDWTLLNSYSGDEDFTFFDTELPSEGEYNYAAAAEIAEDTYYYYSGGIDWAGVMPARAAISIPWPNPCGYQTHLTVELPEADTIELVLYDLAGRRITGHSVELSAGRHTIDFDVDGLAEGVYLLRASIGGADELRRLVISR